MFDVDYAVAIVPALIRASAVTILATIAGMAIAIVLGALIAAVLRRKSLVAAAVAFLVDFIRTTPLLIQLFFVFYVFPIYGITLPASVTGALVLGVHYAAYLAEVYRAGVDAIPNGQWEAARALGLRPWAIWIKVIGPQVFKRIMPQIANYMISMFKDTPVLATIGVMELLGTALFEAGKTYRYFEPIMIVGALFMLFSVLSAMLFHFLERKNNVRP